MNNRQKLIAIIMATTFCGTAMAGEVVIQNHEHERVAVSFSDLNINSQAGATVLYRRIEKAARQVCGITHGLKPIQVINNEKDCLAASIDSAVASVHSDLIENVHAS